MVVMEKPPKAISSKTEVVDYFVKNLVRVSGSEKEAQMCIYNASRQTHFGFCCDIDEGTSRELACLPEVLSVRPDWDIDSVEKDYTSANFGTGSLLSSDNGTFRLFPEGSSKYWLVRVEKPSVEVVTKALMADHCVNIQSKVLGNEDTQMCVYHMSWQKNFGFCCELNEECAKELAGVPAVLSVRLDENFGSENKDYSGGDGLQNSSDPQASNIKTKRLFVTGLSFYTSEKTLHAAFEGFGELVEDISSMGISKIYLIQITKKLLSLSSIPLSLKTSSNLYFSLVKIIMVKISKRAKGYAFIEYTTMESAAAALKEMNGKIINGWMIVVDVTETNPPKYSRVRPSQLSETVEQQKNP